MSKSQLFEFLGESRLANLTRPALNTKTALAVKAAKMPRPSTRLTAALPSLPEPVFEREFMTSWDDLQTGERIRGEGYWWEPNSFNNFPRRQTHTLPFPGEEAFLTKLEAVQQRARQGKNWRVSYSSGRAQYFDRLRNIQWTHYFDYEVKDQHVRPSREFYNYIMDMPL